MNGGLNLSVLDGWWDEMYDGQNGWAIPTADNKASTDERDDIEAAALYELIENHVAPRFYAESADDPEITSEEIPHQWLAMVKHTLATLGPNVSARRMLTDYVQKLYVPACVSGRRALADNGTVARATSRWIERVRQGWPQVHVEHVDAEGVLQEPQIGDELTINAYINLGSLAPRDVKVQVGFGHVSESDHIHERNYAYLDRVTELGSGRFLFNGTLTIDRSGPFGYTVRVLPSHEELAGPAELGLVRNPA